jgi:DNA-binding NtrC family response regulator
MEALIFKAVETPEIHVRIDEAEIARRHVAETDVNDLNQTNAHQVLIVPYPCLESPTWPAIRVRLAQANRKFVVAGRRLGTEQVMTAASDGAFDVLDVKDSRTRWQNAIERAGKSQELWLQLYGAAQTIGGETMIGISGPMIALRQTIERLRATDVTVLVTGESGAGKERVASALHSARGSGPFVAINCAAIPRDLLEAELFGAEKGAFTGAVKSRPGLVEQADGGTLFLDEIGEMDLALQPKMLRFLETRQARRVGGEKDYQVSLRVISATNIILEQAIAEGSFRADLYYRLSEVAMTSPPLRNRKDDVPLLVLSFIGRANERFGKNIESAEPELIRKLQAYDWPGNVRELKSTIERLVLLYDGPVLRAGFWEIPQPTFQPTSAAAPVPIAAPATQFTPGNPLPTLTADESTGFRLPTKADRMDMARSLLAEGRCSLTEVAARLGVHPTTLFRWRKEGKV